MLGLKRRQRVPAGTTVELWLGISSDEAIRMKTSRDRWIEMIQARVNTTSLVGVPWTDLEKPREEWEKEVQVNLWGAINCISSDAGRMGEYREAVYSACKAGIIALSKSVARETGRHGLRLNSVCPGVVVPPEAESISEESMWNQMRDIFTEEVRERVQRNYPLRRLAVADEVANAVVFLASDAASFITGQTLSVSGGYTMI